MLTALDQQADRLRGLDAGADDFLSKPYPGLSFQLPSLISLVFSRKSTTGSVGL
jgi:DNA-binding response OmpR family regulator